MSAPDQQAFFDALAVTWDDLENDATRDRLAAIVAGLGIAPGARVLDVGCGTGILSPLLLSAVGETGFLVSLDLSWKMLCVAQSKGYAASLVQGDAAHPPLAPGAFDWIICNAVLPHFRDKGRALAELGRCLTRSGALIVCHGNSRQFINAIHAEASAAVANDRVPEPAVMAALLREAGLKPLSIVDGADRYVVLAQRDLEMSLTASDQ